VNVYPFIEAEQAERHSVKRACELLEVSRAAFYQRASGPSRRDVADEELFGAIKEAHEGSAGTYGSPRVHRALRDGGRRCGRKRVARIMRKKGLVGRCPKRWRKTTEHDPDAMTTAIDLIQREFGPGVEIDRRWCGDITYVWTWEGWMYLATVIDIASRRVVGWAMADHLRAELVCDALTDAVNRRRPPPGVIFHSDRGCQYTSKDFRDLAAGLGVTLSLGRTGQCWDNALSESWFSAYKTELIHTRSWPTKASARRATFDYIERWYNLRRLHSSLGYRSPAAYEATLNQNAAAQAA
jgi:transposase InsO family protein